MEVNSFSSRLSLWMRRVKRLLKNERNTYTSIIDSIRQYGIAYLRGTYSTITITQPFTELMNAFSFLAAVAAAAAR